MSEIGDYIREKRIEADLTQRELVDEMYEVAKDAGFPCDVDEQGTMVSKWEQGHRTPSAIHRKFLSRALDFTYTDLEELV